LGFLRPIGIFGLQVDIFTFNFGFLAVKLGFLTPNLQ
jgi:hypothetical protein